MASDLKIEIFAYKLFFKLWHDMEDIQVVPDILEIYGDECARDDSYMEAYDDSIIRAAYCRSDFLAQKYMEPVSYEEIIKFKTLSELYDYVVHMCDRDDLFGHLTVFERMLATSNFVSTICYSLYVKTDSFTDALMYGHIIWAMYFDKFTEEFYEKGGWSKLKREVKRYDLLSEFYIIFDGKSSYFLQAIKEATVNYRHFKNVINYQGQKNQHPVYISKAWIQFRIEHFKSYTNIPLSYGTSVNAYEADLLLDDLKLLLDSTRCSPNNPEVSKEKQGSTFSTEMSYSEIHFNSEERKANQNDETQIKPVNFEYENKNIDKVPKNFSYISSDFKKSQGVCQTFTAEELTFDIIDTNINLGSVKNTSTEVEKMRLTKSLNTKYLCDDHSFLPVADMKSKNKTSIKNLPDESDLDHSRGSKLHENKNEDASVEYFYEGNAEEQDGIINRHQDISLYQMKETKSQRMFYLKQHANSNVLGSTSERVIIGNIMGNCKEMTETGSSSKIEGIEIAKAVDDSSSIEIVAPEKNGTTPEDFSTLKDFSSVNENTDYKIIEIRKARENLRQEQKDKEVKNFLRMLPVLGDIEGTKFVLSTLKNIKEGPDGHSDKQKKNSKKKKKK